MPKIAYTLKKFGPDAAEVITKANVITAEYRAQGYDLTLRQLYYQFVARGFIPNSDRSYKRLGGIINDARMAGELDWFDITDRTRNLADVWHDTDPASAIETTAGGYSLGKWDGQATRVEVWVEKEALAGVVARIASEMDVAYFACRGYVSQSEQWRAAHRFMNYQQEHGMAGVILHLGDHDPSGIDMTRDIRDRLSLFSHRHGFDPPTIRRIALNMDQVEEYQPPPNPAKITDSRAVGYIETYGEESWELDALPPDVLADLIRSHVEPYIDRELWQEREEQEEADREVLRAVADRWDDVREFLGVA